MQAQCSKVKCCNGQGRNYMSFFFFNLASNSNMVSLLSHFFGQESQGLSRVQEKGHGSCFSKDCQRICGHIYFFKTNIVNLLLSQRTPKFQQFNTINFVSQEIDYGCFQSNEMLDLRIQVSVSFFSGSALPQDLEPTAYLTRKKAW